MPAKPFDYAPLLRPDLPPAAIKWAGFPKYNFVGGHNDGESVPVAGLVEAAQAVIAREGRTLATYNMESGAQGYLPLRQFLVKKLKADAGIDCTTDEVLVTSGSGQALELVFATLIDKGDTVIVEQCTYGGALTRLRRVGANPIGVPVDEDGLNPAALTKTLEDLKARGIRPKFIYTIPTVQNPTATVMSPARRAEIIKISETFEVPILEDECYADLTFDGKRPHAMRAMAGNDRVIHVGSFSKSIAPALRLGYIVAGWPLMCRLLSVKIDSGTPALGQMIIAEYVMKNFDSHVAALRKVLKRKLDVLTETLAAEFGTAAEFERADGGIFLWIKLPDAVDTLKLFQAASKEGVAINPGVEWSTDKEIGQSRLRICFAHPTEQTIREGVAKLADICHREFGVPLRSRNVGR
jgi:2-aminoadipate transaminase